jgi:hypothetical protein
MRCTLCCTASHHPYFLKQQVDEARAKGARVLCGGAPVHDAAGKGRFFDPTVVADCTHNMSIMTEESFGPVVGIAPVVCACILVQYTVSRPSIRLMGQCVSMCRNPMMKRFA